MVDIKALAAATATIVREHVQREIAPLIAENAGLKERIAALEAREVPAPDAVLIASIVTDAIAALPPAQDGKDAELDADAIARQIDETIARHVARIERPKDGISVTLDDVQPMIDAAVAKAAAAIPVPKDGVGLAGALIDRAGDLVITLTDGTVRPLGPVVGKDYDPDALNAAVRDAVAAIPPAKDGDPGADADPAVIKQMVDEAVALIPPPQDGKDAYPGEARGLYDPAASYRALDVVSFNGSEWRAKTDNPGALPGDDWMLSAQRGRPGKPAVAPERLKGEPGASIVGGKLDADSMELTLVRDDGETITLDFLPFAEAIRGA